MLIKNKDFHQLKIKTKRLFLGMHFKDGLIYHLLVYALLLSFGYIYLYPMLFMVTNSFMTVEDIIDIGVRWVPSQLNIENYQLVIQEINYPKALLQGLYLAAVPSLMATMSSAIIGYGFARFNFPLKKLMFVLMIMTFIVPPQITMLSMFRMYSRYELLGSILAFVFPAVLGQGLNGALFILIFYQFFRMIPKSLEESAQLDGASSFKIFTRIALPLAIPSIIIVFLFSFVWYYNETYLAGLYLSGSELLTLPLRIDQLINGYVGIYQGNERAMQLMQAVKLAGNVLTLLPLLIIYFFTQRYFVESIDRTGITGE
ncbi:MAG: carbohydrate ABC transporter permease [Bacilli bacterium]|nr:carbohydrate ABC transporter permease [Bacilli bacterium]MBN2696021.1 carbohydrate ABC transporter permease [Bacilli bacterium]